DGPGRRELLAPVRRGRRPEGGGSTPSSSGAAARPTTLAARSGSPAAMATPWIYCLLRPALRFQLRLPLRPLTRAPGVGQHTLVACVSLLPPRPRPLLLRHRRLPRVARSS